MKKDNELFSIQAIKLILSRLSKIDILILDCLYKHKTINSHLALEKSKIIPNIDGLSDFKFQISASRLELALLITKTQSGKTFKYHITDIGMQILNLYKKGIVYELKKFEEENK